MNQVEQYAPSSPLPTDQLLRPYRECRKAASALTIDGSTNSAMSNMLEEPADVESRYRASLS